MFNAVVIVLHLLCCIVTVYMFTHRTAASDGQISIFVAEQRVTFARFTIASFWRGDSLSWSWSHTSDDTSIAHLAAQSSSNSPDRNAERAEHPECRTRLGSELGLRFTVRISTV